MNKSPWWKGAHGEWYVVIQVVLFALVIFGPRNWPGWPQWTAPFTWLGSLAGGLILLAGILLVVMAIFRLGPNLTAVPYPKEQATLIETGPYRLVRHPIYCGGILSALGWAFLVHGWSASRQRATDSRPASTRRRCARASPASCTATAPT